MDISGNRIVIDEIPLEHQHDAWRSALNLICLEPRLSASGSILSSDLLLRELPSGARMTRVRSVQQSLTYKKTADTIEDRLLAVFLGTPGSAVFRCGSVTQTITESQILITDFGHSWNLEFSSEFELFIIDVSRDRLLGRIGTRKVGLPVTLNAGHIQTFATALVRSVSERFYSLQHSELASAEAAIVELLVGGLSSCRTKDFRQATQTQVNHLRRVHAAIEEHLADPELSIKNISAQDGLSARYVQRLFERQNITFSAYLRKRRLERCRLDLVDTNRCDQSISEIGFKWGFRDLATFSRAFSMEYGMSPRDLRKSAPSLDKTLLTRGRPYLRATSEGSPPSVEISSPKAFALKKDEGLRSKSQSAARARYHLRLTRIRSTGVISAVQYRRSSASVRTQRSPSKR